MNRYFVNKSILKGEFRTPASKSHTLRAILFGALACGKSLIYHYLPSPDTHAMVEACRLFGAKVDLSQDCIEIQGTSGKIHYAEDVIHAGNSGIILRFCSAVGALSSHSVVVTGDYSIRHHRPMHALLDGLFQLGVSATSMRGDMHAPVIIKGPIRPGKATISGEDSQPVSALLIASMFAEGPVELCVKNPGEKPWVALTLHWLRQLEIPFRNQSFENYHLYGKATYEGFKYDVPGDFSSAAFPIAAALITKSELTIRNIDMKDSQGDKEVISIFQKMGATIEIDEYNKTLYVKKGGELSGITIDINNFIDALTILAVVACYAEGETRIQNATVAKQKECDRIHCIATELRKMGANIEEAEDGLWIKKSTLKGTIVNSYHDHRMVLSLAVAGLGAEGETVISPVECVSKTFPSFLQDFNQVGANIKLINSG